MLIIDQKHMQVVNVNKTFQSYYFFTDNPAGKFYIRCNIASDGFATPSVTVASYPNFDQQMKSFEKLLELLKTNPEVIDFQTLS